MNEGVFMVVKIFFLSSIVIIVLFTFNKIRLTKLSIRSFLTLLKWYVTALVVYYMLSSNQYYFKNIDSTINDGLSLAVLAIISFGAMIYINEYCIERQKLQKLKEIAIASGLIEEKDKES